MAFKNRIRLPLYLRQPQFPQERNVFRKANGETVVLSMVNRKTYQVVTDYMDENMHQKLTIAMSHDNVTIEGDRYIGGVVLDGDYSISYPDFIDFPLGQAQFQIQVTPYNESNNNCQTCEEATQLNCVDDTIGETLGDGGIGIVNVYENDSICCSPITAEIVSFNNTYVQSATIDQVTGDATITLKNPAPSLTNGILARYRVTCPNGGYDEADIYGTIVGTEPSCEPPQNVVVNAGEDSATVLFDPSPSAPTSYIWQLFDCDDLGTPIQSGDQADDSDILLSGLDPATCYIFRIYSDCPDIDSDVVDVEFTTASPATLCGEFFVTADDGTTERNSYSFTYMDCAGVMRNASVVNLSDRRICALTDAGNVPIYLVSSSPFISYIYNGPC